MNLSIESFKKLQKLPKNLKNGIINRYPNIDNSKHFHFCLLEKGGKIISNGENSLKCCKNWSLPFSFKKDYECKTCHAELAAIINLCNKYIKKLESEYSYEKMLHICNKILLLSIALRRNPETNEIDIYPSMPCKVCSNIIQKIGIKKILYFDINRNLCKSNINEWICNADVSFGMRYQNWQNNMNELKANKYNILSLFVSNISCIDEINNNRKNIIICKWISNIRKMKNNMIINIVYKNNKCPVRIQYIRRYNMITDIFNHKYHTIEKSIINDDLVIEMITRKQIVCIVFNRILLRLNEK